MNNYLGRKYPLYALKGLRTEGSKLKNNLVPKISYAVRFFELSTNNKNAIPDHKILCYTDSLLRNELIFLLS